MSKKQKNEGLGSARVVLRIMKDSMGILHWLLLATVLSIASAYLAMKAPEILGNLTNQIYDFLDIGISIDNSLFRNRIIILAGVYLLSALLSALTKAVMNYSVSSFFTCPSRTFLLIAVRDSGLSFEGRMFGVF